MCQFSDVRNMIQFSKQLLNPQSGTAPIEQWFPIPFSPCPLLHILSLWICYFCMLCKFNIIWPFMSGFFATSITFSRCIWSIVSIRLHSLLMNTRLMVLKSQSSCLHRHCRCVPPWPLLCTVGIESRASCMLVEHSPNWATPQVPFLSFS